MTQRDWNEPRPRGTDLDTIDRIMKALREIEAGRAPQTRWEQETYSAAFAKGIVRRPLPRAVDARAFKVRSVPGDVPKKATRNIFERGIRDFVVSYA